MHPAQRAKASPRQSAGSDLPSTPLPGLSSGQSATGSLNGAWELMEASLRVQIDAIPRAPYAAAMAAATVAALGIGLWLAAGQGASGATLMAIGGVIGACAALSIVPLLGEPVVTPERWGLVVMGCSAARTLFAMFGMLILIQMQGLERKPVVYGVLAGAFILMTIEAAVAVWLLGRRESRRISRGGTKISHTTAAGEPAGGSERSMS